MSSRLTYRLKGKNNVDTLKFALFASLLNSIYKAALCIMRRITKNERINAAVAGGLSSLSLLVDAKDRRIFFALVFFARSFVINNTADYYRTLYLICFKRGDYSTSLNMEKLSAGLSWVHLPNIACRLNLNALMKVSELSITSIQL
jgi:hypothetical protein